jgi:hypothetical protein
MSFPLPRLDTLTFDQIKDIVEEYRHQLTHLERSQTALYAAIQEQPNDVDFKSAYDENLVVIENKKNSIIVMQKYLEENDLCYDKTGSCSGSSIKADNVENENGNENGNDESVADSGQRDESSATGMYI